MAKELVIGLAIGAVLKSSFGTAFRTANKTVKQLGAGLDNAFQHQARLGNRIARAQTKQLGLQQRISQSLLTGDGNANKLIHRYERMQGAIGKALDKQNRFTQAIKQAEKAQNSLSSALERQEKRRQTREKLKGDIVSSTAMTASVVMPAWSSVKTYMEQEDAATNLKIAMMKADGTFGQFNEIGKIASELGKDLPGTTKDFYNLAQALKKQGISDKMLTGGALKTSAELNVLLDIKDQYAGGEFLAKFMESHGLKEQELGQSADYLQRAMFASGLNKEQVYESMKYYAPKVNSLGLTGAKNTEKILAIEGIAGQQGLEGSTFGTGFNMMLSRMNKGPKMMRAATKGMKAEAQSMVKAAGVSFDFWDKKGKFKGIEGMFTEMEKFEKIRAKFGDEGVGLVAEELFGIEGGRLADILAKKGKKGLEDMLVKMREQASLQERIAEKTKTLGAALESLGGVWDAAVGTIGSAFAEDIKDFAKWATAFIENDLTPWLKENKSAVKWVVGIAAGMTLMSTAVLAAKFAFSGMSSLFNATFIMPFRLFKAARAIGALDKLSRKTSLFGKVAKAIPSVLSMLGKGIGFVGKAFMWLGRAFLTNPIGLAITAIAVGAYFIWDNWAKIAPLFQDLLQTVSGYFDAAWTWIQSAWSGAGDWVARIWGGITDFFSGLWSEVTTAFDGGIIGIGTLILNWSPIGLFHKAFAAVLSWFGIDIPSNFSTFATNALNSFTQWVTQWDILGAFKTVFDQVFAWFSQLPSRFMEFGGNIVSGLKDGISGFANRAKDNVVGFAGDVSSWFTSRLGIHSPSRVFKGYGLNIVEGVALGIGNNAQIATKRSKQLGEHIALAMPTQLDAPHLEPSESGLSGYQPLVRSPSTTGATSGQVTVHFNPTINLSGNNQDPSLVQQIQQALLNNSYEFEQLLKRVLDQRQRVAY